MGIKGAAVATVIAQYVSGVGILLYFLVRYPEYHISRKDMKWNRENLKQIMSLSGFTCLQQSVMNLGILLVQGLVNSMGTVVMADVTGILYMRRNTRKYNKYNKE